MATLPLPVAAITAVTLRLCGMNLHGGKCEHPMCSLEPPLQVFVLKYACRSVEHIAYNAVPSNRFALDIIWINRKQDELDHK